MQAASGQRPNVKIYGRNYDTPDGTCIRDYIHVTDLCDAHLLALKKIMDTRESKIYNLGNGHGFSVQDVVNMAKKVTTIDFDVIEEARRPGDVAILVQIPREQNNN